MMTALSQYKSKGASHDIGRCQIVNKQKGHSSPHNALNKRILYQRHCGYSNWAKTGRIQVPEIQQRLSILSDSGYL